MMRTEATTTTTSADHRHKMHRKREREASILPGHGSFFPLFLFLFMINNPPSHVPLQGEKQ